MIAVLQMSGDEGRALARALLLADDGSTDQTPEQAATVAGLASLAQRARTGEPELDASLTGLASLYNPEVKDHA